MLEKIKKEKDTLLRGGISPDSMQYYGTLGDVMHKYSYLDFHHLEPEDIIDERIKLMRDE